MDIVITLLLMVALYLIPEILKRKNPKEYKYPEIPEKPNPPEARPLPTISKAPTPKAPRYESQEAQFPPAVAISKYSVSEAVDLRGKETPSIITVNEKNYNCQQSRQLDQAALLNGVIWAEILLPPRAHRPIGGFVSRKAN